MAHTFVLPYHMKVYAPEAPGVLLVKKTGGVRHQNERVPVEDKIASVGTKFGEKLALQIAAGIDRRVMFLLVEDIDDELQFLCKNWSIQHAHASFPAGPEAEKKTRQDLIRTQESIANLLGTHIDGALLFPELPGVVFQKIGISQTPYR